MQTHRAVNWTAGALLFTSLLFATQPGWAAGPQMLRGHVPAGAAKLQPTGRLLATQKLDLVIGLPLRNRQELATLLQQISDLASPSFRHYLTPEQSAQRFGPTEQDYQAVIAFANSNGLKVTGMHPNRTLLDVNATVADIERTFHLKMRT